jgi:hypothetical protein
MLNRSRDIPARDPHTVWRSPGASTGTAPRECRRRLFPAVADGTPSPHGRGFRLGLDPGSVLHKHPWSILENRVVGPC